MNRRQLLELLTVERFAPTRASEPNELPVTPAPVVFDDSEMTTARRRRELAAAVDGHTAEGERAATG